MKMKTVSELMDYKNMWIDTYYGITPPAWYVDKLIQQVKSEGRPEAGLKETIRKEMYRQMDEAKQTTKKFEYVNGNLVKDQIVLISIDYEGEKVQKRLYNGADQQEAVAHMMNHIITVKRFIEHEKVL